ncbi:hypothetical protein K503DRAFT_865211 [Rhizopogon vinicolor AM-OR11-026]|uniref:F-box domain-containing protein n=1 Tax=Rhizopogon vinicolor AM-OR11-026 TaxID=1314800 RepID=A0A1B7N4G9_9AGAM|nr:hypothetical protein K503DRAFT_865211 [Rhizopogon vinicolor AM-OR11-026]
MTSDTEVLFHIFTTIDGAGEGFRDQERDSRVTIAALARTCRAFKEPALDVLWKNINGIKPLISCFPQGVVGKTAEGKLTLGRPPFADEWKLLEQYACRVHSLTIQAFHLDQISDEVVQALVSTPSFPLLPNLRRLEWWNDRDCFFPLLRILLVPTIRSLTLRGSPYMRWSPSFAKSALLASIGVRYPSVREFNCTFDSKENSDVVSKAVCDWHELVHLQTGVLNTQALAHLASLPSLESLSFMTYDSAADTQPQSIPIFTSKLDAVSITCRCASVVIVERFLIHRIPQTSSSPSRSASLQSLSKSLSNPRMMLMTKYLIINVLHFDVIAPLLQFSRLTVLDLTWFCSLDVDDEALKYMAQAWPQLEELYFEFSSQSLVLTSRTFTGLVHLIKYCRHLHHIQMRFVACSIDTDIEPFSTTTANENLTFLDVGISSISNPIAVACQLHALLPNLTHVEYHEWDECTPLPFQEEWDEMNGYLQTLIKSAGIREKRQAK